MTETVPGFETRAIHAGARPDPTTGARSTPIFQTTSFVFEDADHAASLFNLEQFGFIYSRLTNPTVAVFQERLAALEGGVGATCTASGHAAQILALLPLMGPGDELVASRKLYGGSINQFAHTFKKFGWIVRFAEGEAPEDFQAAITDKTKAIFIESLANPGGIVMDIEAIAGVANKAGAPLIVDSTMATPYLCRPFEWGADVITHSTTKFLSGHGNAVGGVAIDKGTFDWSASDKYPALSQPEPGYHGLKFHETFGELAFTLYGHAVGLRDLGAAMAPLNAWLGITGTETLALRMQRHSDNAKAVAEWLRGRPEIEWVNYAGLDDSPYRSLAEKYLPKGAGAVFTFGLKGGYEAGVKLVESVEIISHLANIGDTRSLIIHPASTTHRQLTPEQQTAAGAGPEVVRLSIGLESVDDILGDLEAGLGAAMKAAA